MYEEWNNETNQFDYSNQVYAEAEPVVSMQSVPEPKKKKKSGIKKNIGGGIVFGLTAAIVFCGCSYVANQTFLKPQSTVTAESKQVENEPVKEEIPKLENTQTATTISNVVEGSMTIAQIAQNCMPSIVSITNRSVQETRTFFGTQEYESTSCGSGIVIGQNDTELLIASNNHVVEGANSLSVCFGDSEDAIYEAQIKGTDAKNDLAILAVKTADVDKTVLSSIKAATIGSSDALNVGDQVVAIGNALGYGQSVTTGIVSAVNREVTIDEMTASLIQTDAAINPGNSGGALLNMKGELIGINSAKFASAAVEGMGYAIPIDTAEPILEELMARETRDKLSPEQSGYLGISCQNVDEEASELYGIPQGVYVLSVTEGSAADKAGIVKGDIITKFDGQTIDSAEDLKNTLLYYAANETVVIVYESMEDGGYKEKTATVKLDKNTEAAENTGRQSQGNRNGNSDYYNGLEDFFYGDGFSDFFR